MAPTLHPSDIEDALRRAIVFGDRLLVVQLYDQAAGAGLNKGRRCYQVSPDALAPCVYH